MQPRTVLPLLLVWLAVPSASLISAPSCRYAASLAPRIASVAGDSIDCVIDNPAADEILARVHVRRQQSTAMVRMGRSVPCLSLTHIEVPTSQRRAGHARGTLRALNRIARADRRVLLVENVVSPHMHQLVREHGGEAMPGSRPGSKGCHYWIPSFEGATFDALCQA